MLFQAVASKKSRRLVAGHDDAGVVMNVGGGFRTVQSSGEQ
jgi:hypothetical protein